MGNSIYLDPSIDETLSSLPNEERERVFDALEKLRHEPLRDTHVVSGLNLRTMRAGGQRIYFRYVPEKNTVLVTSVSSVEEPIPA